MQDVIFHPDAYEVRSKRCLPGSQKYRSLAYEVGTVSAIKQYVTILQDQKPVNVLARQISQVRPIKLAMLDITHPQYWNS